MSYSIRFTDEEKRLFDSYAKMHNISLGEALKNALLEKIEDEYDIAVYKKAKKEFDRNPKTYTIDEIEEMYGLK